MTPPAADSEPSATPTTLAEALAQARRLGVDRREAQWMLEHALDRPRSWLAARADEPLEAAGLAAWRQLVARRRAGEPLGYLLGTQSFGGVELSVDRRVLVPRADTETLVDWAIERLDASAAVDAPSVVDLGTGSGAIALALARVRPQARIVATDLSADALAVARANGERAGLEVGWRQGDWWAAVAGRRFNVAVSNPPYIAAGDPHLPGLRHEPALALVSGADGLDAIREIVATAAAHLEPGGWLLLEHGFEQGASVRALLQDSGFEGVETRRDAGGRERCSGGAAA